MTKAKIKWPPRLSETHHGNGGWPAHVVQPAARLMRRRLGQPCEYCGTMMSRSGRFRATRDHVFPKSKGNRLLDLNGFNRAIVCAACNSAKMDLNIVEWWFRLRHGGDPRATIVFGVIERIWFSGAMPELPGDAFDAMRHVLQEQRRVTR